MQIDYGVVDEGKDFQLKPGLVGIAVLDHVRVCIGDGAAGKREGDSLVLNWPSCFCCQMNFLTLHVHKSPSRQGWLGLQFPTGGHSEGTA